MAQWREAYVAGVGTPADWNNTYAEVYTNLLSWRQRASVQDAVKTIAQGLLSEGMSNRWALTHILAAAQVQLVPEPYFRPILPAPQRSTAPTARQPVSTRQPGAAAPSTGRRADYSPVELASNGPFGLFKLVSKSTGSTFFVISRDNGTDRQGQLAIDTWEYASEAEARREFARLA